MLRGSGGRMTRKLPDDNELLQQGKLSKDPEADAIPADPTSARGHARPWEAPEPLGLSDLPPFPTFVLPPSLRTFVADLAEAAQVPVDMPAMLSLAAIAACVQRRVVVEVKQGYFEPLSLFVAVVLEPGNRKSTVVGAVTEPIRLWEQSQAERLGPDVEKARTERAIKTKRKAKLERDAAEAKTHGDAADWGDQAARLAAELAADNPPTYPRVLADDTTPEQLARLMAEQGERMAIFSAEGGIFETMGGRYASGVPNLDIFLKGHAGDWLKIDRRSDGVGSPVAMHRPALTMGLAVQPDVLRGLIDKPVFAGRGLLARFLYSLPTSPLGRRRLDTPPVDEVVLSAYRGCLGRLLDGREESARLVLSAGATGEWRALEGRIEPRLARGRDLNHVAGWAAKAAGAAVRIAGVLHSAECAGRDRPVGGEIARETMRAAVVIVEDYLIPHALAAFAEMGADPNVSLASVLLDWLVARDVREISTRDAHRALRGQVRFREAEAVERAFVVLEQHAFVRRLVDPPREGPGRPPAARYAVSPMAGGHGQNTQNGQNPRGAADFGHFGHFDHSSTGASGAVNGVGQ